MLRRAASHLTYANVMATVALFVAVGGSAYAALKIDGRQIVSHSIPASKLARGIVVPHAALADNVSTLRLSSSTGGLGGRAARTAAASSGSSGTVIPMSVGQSIPVIQDGPFTINARCVDQGNNRFLFYLDATSTATSWVTFDVATGNAGTFQSGNTAEIYQGGGSIPIATTINGFLLLTGDGQAYVFNFAYTVHEFSDCGVSGYAVG
jgi:hypothetical protein